ncbi:MAG TPA: accessory factor UbiK family protein [Allosphingosinicella sp.]|nr:accessory factor UbiK family protein [Allosphingosinicella sp.]
MQSQNRLFDDFVKVMNGAAGTIAGMTREAQAAMQERARDWIGGLDMVSREEFEALKLRIEALEAALAAVAAASPEPAAAPRRRRGGASAEGGEGAV